MQEMVFNINNVFKFGGKRKKHENSNNLDDSTDVPTQYGDVFLSTTPEKHPLNFVKEFPDARRSRFFFSLAHNDPNNLVFPNLSISINELINRRALR